MLLGDYILDHEIDVEETQQRSLFELFRKANGGEELRKFYSSNQGWQPTSTKRVLLQRPQSSPSLTKTPYLDTDFVNPSSTISDKQNSIITLCDFWRPDDRIQLFRSRLMAEESF